MTTDGAPAQTALVLVAAGSSTRMGGVKKEYLPLDGGTVLSCAARAFLAALPVDAVAVAFPRAGTPGECAAAQSECMAAFFADGAAHPERVLFVPGGATRQESVLNALRAVHGALGDDAIVFIHDGARPFVSADIIRETYRAALQYGAAAPALTPVDTQKAVDAHGFIARHLARAELAAVQTPQAFTLGKILAAHERAAEFARLAIAQGGPAREFTDDTEIWDAYAGSPHGVKLVAGSAENKKITYKTDIPARERRNAMVRTGLGYDKHVLVEGRKLLLGGVEIPFEKGEAGHSDGDVLLHAVTDALLGASALGDIGSYFPPTDAQWKDADSRTLLATVWRDITGAGWRLGNLDCVIALERPKFLPYRDDVRASIAAVLGCAPGQIFVKAKTGEKLGDVGTGKAVEAWATCLLEKD